MLPVDKHKGVSPKPIEKRGGYGSGDKRVSDLKPPPSGPAPGVKPPAGDDRKR